MSPVSTDHRYVEIDLLRSVAILCMVIYHTAYDLWAFYDWHIDPVVGGWWLFAHATASLFLLLVGVSFAISWHFATSTSAGSKKVWWKYLRRGVMLFFCGMLVSIVTYLFDPATYVRFGILHCIGVSVALLPLFTPLREWSAFAGIAMIVGGWMIKGLSASTFFLLPFGVTPPWFGVVLIGYAIGHAVYIRRHFRSSLTCRAPLCRALTWPGRYALPIYLFHQPILLLLLWAMNTAYLF
jgi:uncharacterized membrane protein